MGTESFMVCSNPTFQSRLSDIDVADAAADEADAARECGPPRGPGAPAYEPETAAKQGWYYQRAASRARAKQPYTSEELVRQQLEQLVATINSIATEEGQSFFSQRQHLQEQVEQLQIDLQRSQQEQGQRAQASSPTTGAAGVAASHAAMMQQLSTLQKEAHEWREHCIKAEGRACINVHVLAADLDTMEDQKATGDDIALEVEMARGWHARHLAATGAAVAAAAQPQKQEQQAAGTLSLAAKARLALLATSLLGVGAYLLTAFVLKV